MLDVPPAHGETHPAEPLDPALSVLPGLSPARGAVPPYPGGSAPQLPAVPERDPGVAGDPLDGLLDDDEDTLSLVLDGVVDARLETQLAGILDAIRSSGVRHIVLEMATVTSMDAAALRFLFAVRRLADERAGSVRLADAPAAVRAMVAAAGAAEVLDGADERPGARPA